MDAKSETFRSCARYAGNSPESSPLAVAPALPRKRVSFGTAHLGEGERPHPTGWAIELTYYVSGTFDASAPGTPLSRCKSTRPPLCAFRGAPASRPRSPGADGLLDFV